jgi:glycosyltransferase involved in cell wall biosynthesis
MIKPLLISTHDINGGAPRATYRLHQGLNSIGIQSQILVQTKETDTYTVLTDTTKFGKAFGKFTRTLDALPLQLYPHRDSKLAFSAQWVPDSIAAQVTELDPDVVNLHWTNGGFVQIETLAKIKKPIVWTLHDMWLFTGGCNYNGDCTNYTSSCGACPQLHSNKENDLSRWIWKRKQKSWQGLELNIVTPSHWLADCAAFSPLIKDKRIQVIPNGINTEQYKPIQKSIVRSILGLPLDKHLILFGAMSPTSNPRKGFHLLQPALLKLSQNGWADRIEVIIFGASQPEKPLEIGFKVHYLGKLKDEISLALVYAAADLFIAPSVQDNLPNTIMESLSCGTPCVGFDIGGIPDMIEHKQNGYLAKPFDIDDLAQGITWVIEDQERWHLLSKRSREKVEQEFTLEIQAKEYLKLYQSLVKPD